MWKKYNFSEYFHKFKDRKNGKTEAVTRSRLHNTFKKELITKKHNDNQKDNIRYFRGMSDEEKNNVNKIS